MLSIPKFILDPQGSVGMKVFQSLVNKAKPRVEEMDLLAIPMCGVQGNLEMNMTKESTALHLL